MDASVGRVQIFDYWNVEDELIAEGVLLSAEPNQLVNDIPLGPNAAVIKIEVVVKDSAFGDQRLECQTWVMHYIRSLLGQLIGHDYLIQLLNLPRNLMW